MRFGKQIILVLLFHLLFASAALAVKAGDACSDWRQRPVLGYYVSESGYCMAETLSCRGDKYVKDEVGQPATGKCPGGRVPSCKYPMEFTLTVTEGRSVEDVMAIFSYLSTSFYDIHIRFSTDMGGGLSKPWRLNFTATPWFERPIFAHLPDIADATRETMKAGLEKKYPGVIRATACPVPLQTPSVIGSN